MHFAHRAQIAVRILVAFWVTLGMSAPALSMLTCAIGMDKAECPMRTPRAASIKAEAMEAAEKGCCASKKQRAASAASTIGEKEDKGPCCCSVKGAPSTQAAVATAAPMPVQVLLVSQAPNVLLVLQADVPAPRAIYFYSDASPPSVSEHPDLGRAPPVA